MRKWARVSPILSDRGIASRVYFLNGRASTDRHLREALNSGETDFIAAGGDGTVNALLNALIGSATPAQLGRVRFGAIGLGSSNDFHKPFGTENLAEGIPCRLDLSRARPRDVGCVTCRAGSGPVTRYFLVNASIGATADANDFFNRPDGALRLLKRVHTPSAILYAALRTISSHRNLHAVIQSPEVGTIPTTISYLGVMKSPHFSGSLRFNFPARFSDGRLAVQLFPGLERVGLLRLLIRLAEGRSTDRQSRSWSTRLLTVTADCPFAVEFDGEIVRTSEARFSILPQFLKVCP